MAKIVFGYVGLMVLFAIIGMTRNLQVKVDQMPPAIKYQIVTYENTWPDQFYASDYSKVGGGTGFRLENYWTFEPSKHFLGAGKWVFHSEPLEWENVNSIIRELVR